MTIANVYKPRYWVTQVRRGTPPIRHDGDVGSLFAPWAEASRARTPFRATCVRMTWCVALLAVVLAADPVSAQPVFNFRMANDFTRNANANGRLEQTLQRAARAWSAFLADDVTINIDISSSLAGASGRASGVIELPYGEYRAVLGNDVTTYADYRALWGLPSGSSVPRLISRTQENGGSPVAYVDYEESIHVVRPLAKALGLISPHDSGGDGSIEFSQTLYDLGLYDDNPDDGILPWTTDFVGNLAHEIGHVLGFDSKLRSFYPGAPESSFPLFAMDLFRNSDASRSHPDGPMLDYTLDNDLKYFSVEPRSEPLGLFANFDDGHQPVHWKHPPLEPQGRHFGIMTPVLEIGESNHVVSTSDLAVLDLIGWDRVGSGQGDPTVPSVATLDVKTFSSADSDTDDLQLDFGPTRVGTVKSGTLGVDNAGQGFSALRALFDNTALAPPFPAQYDVDQEGTTGILFVGDGEVRDYAYAPTARSEGVPDTGSVVVNAGFPGTTEEDVVVELTGTGVGPLFDCTLVSGSTFDFGSVPPGNTATLEGLIRNASTDDDLGRADLTDLTLVDITLEGPDAPMFDLIGLTPGIVLHKGEEVALVIEFSPTGPAGSFGASVTIVTDEGAVVGEPGATFTYQLTGAAAVPEPATFMLLGLGGGVLLARVHCERQRKTRHVLRSILAD